MTRQPPAPLDYNSRADQSVRFEPRALVRYFAVLAATLGLLWSLSLRSHLVLSDGGVVGGNHAGVILSMVKYSPAENWDLVPYVHWTLPLGFHRVDWSRWRRNGQYLLVPKWVLLAVTGSALAVSIALVLRRRPAG